MRISVHFDFDPGNRQDIDYLKTLLDSIGRHNANNGGDGAEIAIETAWRQCSWELVAFALTVLKIRDGESEKGVYAFFRSLCNPDFQETCGPMTDRGISSLVGRATVICKQLGDFRIMHIATRRKDNEKRVYVDPEARECLLQLLKSEWGDEFRRYLADRQLRMPDFSAL